MHDDFQYFNIISTENWKIIQYILFSSIMHPWNYFRWFLDKIVKLDLHDLLLSMASAIFYLWEILLSELIWISIVLLFFAPLT